MNIKIIELFGGIGAPRKALNNLGVNVKTVYVENNKKVIDVYNAIYNENEEKRDVKNFKPKKDKYELLVGGFPCQPFSIAGKRLGFEDERGKLYKDTLRIIEETLPDNIILENVKGILRKENIWIIEEIVSFLENLNYSVIYKVINAYDFGNMQKRERIFIIASKIKKLNLESFEKYLEPYKKFDNRKNEIKEFFNQESEILTYDIDKVKEAENYFIIPRKKDGKLISGSYNRVWKYGKAIGTITISNTLKIGLIKNNKLYYRQITPKEGFLSMGFSEIDYNSIKNSKISKSSINFVAGNSMIVGIMEIIISFIFFN